MKSEELTTLLHARPFRPFEIHLTDARSYVIEHPDFLMFSKDRETVTVALDPDEQNDFRTRETIDIRRIVSVTENSTRRPRRRNRKAS